jgi:ATP-dependent RNA helicase DeaD
MSSDTSATTVSFRNLALNDAVLKALDDVGYETPSPIQAAIIPHVLAGKDVIGQAQTGTGKTAAFALPILSNIDLNQFATQALVLAPTRELAIQVAEAFQRYAVHLKNFHVLPIYGGQSYEPQLKALKRGVHVVVGTPGRVMDHMKRGTLRLDALRWLVLDEADEMLRMGFIDDVEWVLTQTPPTRQVALFSATMPSAIRRIAQTHLKSPVEITIKSKTTTATNIRQRYWMVSGASKLDGLTRILEAEPFEGMLIFARTKAGTEELAGKLAARGYAVAPLNGDVAQAQRERTVQRLKDGQLDIVVATDVAARGLDVERISHVINYDIPTDTESYVHRIGRTGRAGRSGEAILFIAPRERHMLKVIERATRQNITQMELPSPEAVNDLRLNKFKQKITETLATNRSGVFRSMLEQYEREHQVPMVEIAAALVQMAQGATPLLLDVRSAVAAGPARQEFAPQRHVETRERSRTERTEPRSERPRPESRGERPAAAPRPESRPEHRPEPRHEARPEHRPATRPEARPDARPEPAPERPKAKKSAKAAGVPMELFRIEVGSVHGAAAANIVGAIANEAGVESQYIGRIEIGEDHSTIELPEGMPKEIFRDLQKVWVSGQQLKISRVAVPNPFTEQKGKHSKKRP